MIQKVMKQMQTETLGALISILVFFGGLFKWRTKANNLGPVLMKLVNRGLNKLDRIIYASQIADLSSRFAEIILGIYKNDGTGKINPNKFEKIRLTLQQLKNDLGE